MNKAMLVGAIVVMACVSAPPALSTFPARAGAVWSQDCCGEPLVGKKPAYPQAVPSGQDGWVIVSGILDERGWVTETVVLASEPEGVFDAAALQAFDGWRYAAPNPAVRREVRAVLTFRPPLRPGAQPSSSGAGGMSGGGGGAGY